MALSIPQHTHVSRNEHCADSDTCLSGAREDDAAEHDDDDAQPCAATDVFPQEDASDDSGCDEFEVQEQRHGSCGSAIESEDE